MVYVLKFGFQSFIRETQIVVAVALWKSVGFREHKSQGRYGPNCFSGRFRKVKSIVDDYSTGAAGLRDRQLSTSRDSDSWVIDRLGLTWRSDFGHDSFLRVCWWVNPLFLHTLILSHMHLFIVYNIIVEYSHQVMGLQLKSRMHCQQHNSSATSHLSPDVKLSIFYFNAVNK